MLGYRHQKGLISVIVVEFCCGVHYFAGAMFAAKLSHQNGLGRLHILHENPIFMSIWVKWYHHNLDRHKDEIFTEKYGAVQVHFGEVVLP